MQKIQVEVPSEIIEDAQTLKPQQDAETTVRGWIEDGYHLALRQFLRQHGNTKETNKDQDEAPKKPSVGTVSPSLGTIKVGGEIGPLTGYGRETLTVPLGKVAPKKTSAR